MTFDPFKPKFTAQKVFTDRESFKQILMKAVEQEQRFDQYRILMFYGFGGKGKSYLKDVFFVNDYLKTKATKDPQIICCDYIDFDKKEITRQPDNSLLGIAKILIEKGHLSLPAFSVGYIKYKSLASASKNLQQEYPFLFNISSHKIFGSNLAGDIVSELIGFASETAAQGVPLIGHFLKKLADKGKDKLNEWVRKSQNKEILGDIDQLNATELLNRLPVLLAYDVYNMLQEEANAEGVPTKRIIITIDGYEALWRSGKYKDPNMDKWVRTLIKMMPGVLFVLFGRDKLKWNEIPCEDGTDDSLFLEGVEQHLLDGLSDNDAEFYLKSVPISDTTIIKTIIHNAKAGNAHDGCLPLYLDLEVNTYVAIMNSGKIPVSKDFEQGNEKIENSIITRLFNHLSEQDALAIKALSLCRYFDQEIIDIMLKHQAFAPGISVIKLSEYSFIYQQNDRAVIHALVREVAADQFKREFPEKCKVLNAELYNYFENKIAFTESTHITPSIENILSYAAHHLLEIHPEQYPDWIIRKASLTYGSGFYGTIADLLLKAVTLINDSGSGSVFMLDEIDKQRLLAKLHYWLGVKFEWHNKYLKAEEHIEKSVAILERIYQEKNLKNIPAEYKSLSEEEKSKYISEQVQTDISSYVYSCQKAAEIVANLKKNVSCGIYWKKIKDLNVKYGFSFDETSYNNYLVNIGREAEAEPYFYNKYLDAVSQSENYDILNFLLNLINIYIYQERFSEARHYLDICFDTYAKLEEENKEWFAAILFRQANLIIREGKDVKKAMPVMEEINELLTELYSDNHLNFAFYYDTLFELFLESDLKKALEYYKTAKNIYSENIGSWNTHTIGMQIMIVEHLVSSGELESNRYSEMVKELLKFFDESYLQLVELFGYHHRLLLRGMETCATILNKKGEKEKAELLLMHKKESERILLTRTKIRTHNWPLTVITDPVEKEKLLSAFIGTTSLPVNHAEVEIECYTPSFYKVFKFYKVIFISTEKKFCKYLLYNNEICFPIEWNSGNLHRINALDFNLTKEIAEQYLTFFCEAINGDEGRFYLLLGENEMPWRMDIHIDDSLKTLVTKIIRCPALIGSDENKYELSGTVLYGDVLFYCVLEVNLKDGVVSMVKDERVVIIKTNAPVYTTIEFDKAYELAKSNEIGDEDILLKFPAYIDPPFES